MSPAPSAALPFNPPFAEDDKAIAARLLAGSRLSPEREKRVDEQAVRLIEAPKAAASAASRRCCGNTRSPPRKALP
jgi:RHH-type transcriptional regulator, proline utilization regulon repressor / proline dehydrogenase / delta 1-pyrroline-5-carboxylate dehydrogenase